MNLTPHQVFVAAIGGFCAVLMLGMVGVLFVLA
jgi:hypothetical protein